MWTCQIAVSRSRAQTTPDTPGETDTPLKDFSLRPSEE